MKRNLWIVVIGIVGLLILRGQVGAEPAQQAGPTATPVQVVLPTALPILPTDEQDALGSVNSSITRTPTPEAAAMLEALTEANVRAQPDPNAERLGSIRAGDTYTVIGQYYQWYEFQFDQSPSGTGWVFSELVNVTGNTANIPDLTQNTPTPDAALEQANSTLVVLTQTPGGLLTATARVGVIPLPVEGGSTSNGTSSELPGLPVSPNAPGIPTALPTFTSPPNIAPAPTNGQPIGGTSDPNITIGSPPGLDITVPSRIPPIVPILVLGGAGILGLVISSLRK